MKIVKNEGFGEIRAAWIGDNGPEKIIIYRDNVLNFGDVVQAKITSYHPILKGYFAESDGKAVFIPTTEKMVEGQTVRLKIVKEARRDKDAVGRITTDSCLPFAISGEAVSAKEMDEILEDAMRPDVPFYGGGMLHIERTRVCWTIDVDSGNSIRPLSQINQASVPEICRQIRLKNMGGIILIDFAGTKRACFRQELKNEILKHISDDSLARFTGWTPDGLAEIERRRERADLWLACSKSNPINTYYRVRQAIAAAKSGNPKVYVSPVVLQLLKQSGVRARLEPVFDKPTSYFEVSED